MRGALALLAVAACSSRVSDPRAAAPPAIASAADAGDTAAPGEPPPPAPPIGAAIPRLTGAVWNHDELAAHDQVCALRDDGRVMCWGQNNYGEVGDRKAVQHPVPILVPR